MTTIFDLRHDIDRDDWELGIRVACAFFVENVTEPDNFVKILKLKHDFCSKGRRVS